MICHGVLVYRRALTDSRYHCFCCYKRGCALAATSDEHSSGGGWEYVTLFTLIEDKAQETMRQIVDEPWPIVVPLRGKV